MFRLFNRCRQSERQPARSRFFRPLGEMLEDRRQMAAFNINGTGGNDIITLKESGANYVATVNGSTLTAPASSTTAITVTGLAGNDRLDVDFSGGNFGGLTINYSGGDPTTGTGDSLRVLGGSFASAVSTPTGTGAGSIAYTGGTTGSATISYSGLEPIDDLATVVNYTINATNALNFTNIVNGPVVSGTQTTQVNDGAALFEKINFANKTNVILNALDGADQISLNNALVGVGLDSLVINGGNGDDTVFVTGTGLTAGTSYTLNGGANDDKYSFSGGLLAAPVTVNGDADATEDAITVLNAASANVTQTGNQFTFSGGQPLTVNSLERVELSNANTFTISGTASSDTLVLSKPGVATYRSVLNGGLTVNFSAPVATIGGQFFANLGDDTDTLAVDNAGRLVNLRVAFNANAGTNDRLSISGDPGTGIARESYIAGGLQDNGRVILDPDGNQGFLKTTTATANGDELDINFSSADLIDTDTPADIFDAVLSTSADTATLAGSASPLNGKPALRLVDNSASFATTSFANKGVFTLSGFVGDDTVDWSSGSAAESLLTRVEIYGFLPPGLGVDDHPASSTNRDIVNISENAAAVRNLSFGFSETASVLDIQGLPAPTRVGTAETVRYSGTSANNDTATIVDGATSVNPARVFNLTANGASYTRNGGVLNQAGSAVEAGPDLQIAGLSGTGTSLIVDGGAPTTLPGDFLVYDGPANAATTPADDRSGDIEAAGVIGVHYQNFERQTLPGLLIWDGGGTTDLWSEAANWDTNTVPTDGVTLVFPTGVPTSSLSNANDISGLDLNVLRFTGGGYNITGNGISLSSGLAANASAGKISFRPNITLTGAQTFVNLGISPVTLDATLNLNGFALTVDGQGDFNQIGRVIGAGGLTKNGTGELLLQSLTSNYTGVTQINGGTVKIVGSTSLGAAGVGNGTVVAAGATLQIGSNTTNVPEAVTLEGLGVGGAGALQTFQCVTGCSLSGLLTLPNNTKMDVGQADSLTLGDTTGSGAASLSKTGAGSLVLAGTSSVPGSVLVFDGKLLVNGTIANGTAAVIGQAGNVAMGGTGTINRPVVISSGGQLAPGNSPGVVSTGNLSLSGGAAFDVEIAGASTGQFDQVSVTGTVLIATAGGGVTLNLAKSGTVNLQAGQQLAIIANDGTDVIQGTFKDLPEGANLGSNFLGTGLTAKLSYKGFSGTQNDVVLTMSPGSLFPWHNGTANKANDVRGATSIDPDGHVVADDALAVINFINALGAGPVPANAVLGLPFGFLDTVADNQIVAEDVLAVINFINAGLGGEGESPTSADDVAAATMNNSASAPASWSSELLLLLATDLASQPTPRRRG